MIGQKVRRNMSGHGIGRHSREEIIALGNEDVDAIAAVLGDKPWFLGSSPTGADATIWPFVASVLCPYFTSPMIEHGARHANLIAYRDRGLARWYPDFTGPDAKSKSSAGA